MQSSGFVRFLRGQIILFADVAGQIKETKAVVFVKFDQAVIAGTNRAVGTITARMIMWIMPVQTAVDFDRRIAQQRRQTASIDRVIVIGVTCCTGTCG